MMSLQKAFHFLCLVFFYLNFQPNLSSSSSCSHDQASALIQFKSSFTIDILHSSAECDDVGIKSYPKTDSWKQGTDCCSWDGVTCDNITGRVLGLDLSCSWLHATIPSNSSLFHLPHLQKLNLAHNNFHASKMSSKFGEFACLVYLNLSASNFAGQVPSQVSHLSKLVSLDLSGNDLHIFDKHSLEGLVHNLTKVRQLVLDGIEMSSVNPDVLMNLSSSIISLSLCGCDLQGKFPEYIFHLPNLKSLYLGDNKNLSLKLLRFNRSNSLELLDLSAMSFSTESVDGIGKLQSLKYLHLSKTSFSKRLFDSIGNLVSLKGLDLSSTNLTGSIPSLLGNLSSSLRSLNLVNCGLQGKLLENIFHMPSLSRLEFLDLGLNQLKGSIPDEESVFPNLISLDLSSNLLNGTLPPWLFDIPSLKSINLSYNQFSGPIKEFRYNSLERIDLYNNKIQGPIPSSISQLLDLTHLHLSSNNLSGVVEYGMFSKLQKLQYLDLSSNSLSLILNGTSADYILPNLQILRLSSCNVNDFPQFLKGSKSLRYLDLSNNGICGKIPKWVGKISFNYLNLSHNFLTDIDQQLPWKGIQFLDLSSNLIHGDLPIPP
ncbi:hypothetical protein PTKIN_Ptkin14bG0025700 [Pterospermum kingtungense]